MDDMARYVVRGAKVNSEKVSRARDPRRSMTPGETTLWKCLRASQFEGFHFRRQQVIEGFIVDYYCHAARLIIEIDGGVHDTQIEYDEERDKILTALGFRVLRIHEDDVIMDLISVLAQIRAALQTP